MLSNNLIKHAKFLNFQGQRHPLIKAVLIIMEILHDLEKRKLTEEDPERFLSKLGFIESDTKKMLNKNSYSSVYSETDKQEFLSIIGLTQESIDMFGKYGIIVDILNSKKRKSMHSFSAEDVLKDKIYLSDNGNSIVKQMYHLFEPALTKLYYRYFNVR
ncbi:MAG: hypothetical protein WDK96_00135 [Candidatus Paceibacterota bacterium]|jgi:hypothetical protein